MDPKEDPLTEDEMEAAQGGAGQSGEIGTVAHELAAQDAHPDRVGNSWGES